MNIHNKFARARLLKDLKELKSSKIPNIFAVPMNDNLFEFHVNILVNNGVYNGLYVHLIMIFTDEYPKIPPQIKVCTPIKHRKIFGEFLCLNILRSNTSNKPYNGWSSAYSITSILMQLQLLSFSFVDNMGNDFFCDDLAKNLKKSINRCKEFKCEICGHSHDKPYPVDRLQCVLSVHIYSY